MLFLRIGRQAVKQDFMKDNIRMTFIVDPALFRSFNIISLEQAPGALIVTKGAVKPIASFDNVHFQHNLDVGIGASYNWRYTLNFQPVTSLNYHRG